MPLKWDQSYSVGVKTLDNQHKKLFKIVNDLIDVLNNISVENKVDKVDEIIKSLVKYKDFHFKTEEEFFDKFNYEKKEEHKLSHKVLGDKLYELTKKNINDSITLSFELVDFLEDWLIDHLMDEDKKYIKCFKEHGLK